MRFSAHTLALALLLTACGGKGGDTADSAAATTGSGTTAAGTGTGTGTATGGTATGGTTGLDGEALYASHCAACHGADGKGNTIGPDLEGEVMRHSDEELVDVMLNGDGSMAPVAISEDEAYAIAGWLRTIF